MSLIVTEATAETIAPKVEIKNGPCVNCIFWINKNCRIDKTPDLNLDCSYYSHED